MAKPVKSEKRNIIKGATNFQINSMKKIKIKKPQRERKTLKLKNLAGKSEKRTFEPSSGGIGIKLKKAKTKLVITIIEVI